MESNDDKAISTLTLTAKLKLFGDELSLSLTVQDTLGSAADVLPIARALTEKAVAFGVETAQAAGETVSCREGCGACCRQLIAISLPEAQRLTELVAEMPEERRLAITERFAAIKAATDAVGMTEQIIRPKLGDPQAVMKLGLDYLKMRLPCPFLEKESCSIYTERPLICREFLVTSPAENCDDPKASTITRVPLPVRNARAMQQLDVQYSDAPLLALSLLPTALAAYPTQHARRRVPELVQEFFEHLTSKTLPPAPGALMT